jgi:hypothetical protein
MTSTTPKEIGRQIVEAVKSHSRRDTIRGQTRESVIIGRDGRVVFGPASSEECDEHMYELIGRIALAATAVRPA